jgi:3-phosphoshikimate 1-carboxyvinyltransferase
MSQLTVATVRPAGRIHGRLSVPGDKSISHRYALLGALADGTTTIDGYAPGADCRSSIDCLRALGVTVRTSGSAVAITGRGLGGLQAPAGPLDCGNSGTTMRLFAGALAGHRFTCRMIGDASLSRRPMRRVVEPLSRMGASFDTVDGHPPLVVHGARLHGLAFEPDVPSAQVKSAVLLAGLHADGDTSVREPARTRDHTERALEAFGVSVARDGLRVGVRGGSRLRACALSVPGDFSSAAFWLVAAAALPGSRIEIADVGLNPTRTALLDVLRRFGARVVVEPASEDAGEPRGTVIVEADRQSAVEIAPHDVPGLIDELPAVAALAAHGGRVTVRGAAELRVKESDRIATLVAGFRALGIAADEQPDGFVVSGPAEGDRARGGRADAKGDHRMAMAFAIAALGAREASAVDGADAVDVSYPGFFETLARLQS